MVRMAALLDSDSSDGEDEDFEGFVVSPEEKASYKAWTRKRRASHTFDSGSDSEDNLSGDEDEDEEEEDDEDDDDSESAGEGEEEHEEENDELDAALDDVNLHQSGEETLSSHTDQCPVCLMSLKEQLLGTPNNCPHVFCFECIQEWSKNATTCPVGRKPYTEILVHATRKGPVLQRIPVEVRTPEDDDMEVDPTYCEVCGFSDREERMLLCDGCDNGYHMECLTPPAEYVPIEEWYCPVCSTQPETHEDPEDPPQEVHREQGLREIPRGRPRGRPRGSTARRVSVSGRTDSTRRARTVATTRGRRTTLGGRGRGRGRSGSRGSSRGGRRSSTRGRSSKTTTGRKRKRRKRRSRSIKKTGSSSTKRGKRSSKTKKVKPSKRRRVVDEDEVSPFVYEPVRRGKTVHARLLESLNTPGSSTEPGRSASLGRVPFPSRVEPSSSFSLFGNTYALHDFVDQEEDTPETSRTRVQTTAWSSESTNPDVLGSIFQGLDSLRSPSVQVARDGKLVLSTDQSSTKDSKNSDAKSISNNDEVKRKTDLEIKQRPAMEAKSLEDKDKIAKNPDIAKRSSNDKHDSDKLGSAHENIFEKLSSKSTEKIHAGSCRKLSDTGENQNTSLSSSTLLKSSLSPLSTSPSSKPALSGFRIPKRSSISKDEPNQTPLSFGGSLSIKQEQSQNSGISNFKIPKRIKTSCDGNPMGASSSTVIAKSGNLKCVGQALVTPSSRGIKQTVTLTHGTSPNKVVAQSICFPESKATGSSRSYLNSVRPVVRANSKRQDSVNMSTTVPEVTNSSSVTKCHANNITGITHRHTITSRATSPSVTISSNTTACTTKIIDAVHSHTRTSNTSSPVTKVASLIEQPAAGKQQRRSNIEIIKMLQEKQRSMREEMSGDPKCISSSRDQADASVLQQKGLHVSDKSPKRGITLPVAVVKPSVQTPSVTVNAPSLLRSNSSENSPVKSIASGIIDAHSGNTQEFKRVRSEFEPRTSLGLKLSGSSIGHEAGARKRVGETVPGAHSDREQQRKLGIARLQRHEQIVDEVKLALKPFFKHGEINRDEYKLIMKKSVEKIKESSSSVDRDRVCRLVKKYIKKIKGDNFHLKF